MRRRIPLIAALLTLVTATSAKAQSICGGSSINVYLGATFSCTYGGASSTDVLFSHFTLSYTTTTSAGSVTYTPTATGTGTGFFKNYVKVAPVSSDYDAGLTSPFDWAGFYLNNTSGFVADALAQGLGSFVTSFTFSADAAINTQGGIYYGSFHSVYYSGQVDASAQRNTAPGTSSSSISSQLYDNSAPGTKYTGSTSASSTGSFIGQFVTCDYVTNLCTVPYDGGAWTQAFSTSGSSPTGTGNKAETKVENFQNIVTYSIACDSSNPDAPCYVPPITTPEPASLTLLGSGLLGLAGFARRRRKAA